MIVLLPFKGSRRENQSLLKTIKVSTSFFSTLFILSTQRNPVRLISNCYSHNLSLSFPGNISKSIADVISLYITLCDKLQMDMRAKDELYTDLKCLVEVLDRMSNLPSDFEGTNKVNFW